MSLLDEEKTKSHITHRRFLGYNDFKTYICIQFPEKNRIPGDREDDEVILLNKEPEQEYNCNSCCFTTKRLEVMIIHMKFHFSGVTASKLKKKGSLVSKSKKDLKKPRSSLNVDSYRSSTVKQFSSQKRNKSKSLVILPEAINEEKPKDSSNIRSDLLAEWDDSDDEMDCTLNTQSSSIVEVTDSSILDETCDKTGNEYSQCEDTDSVVTKETPNLSEITESHNLSGNILHNDKTSKIDHDTHQAIKSCFDFDEDDEEEGIIPTAVTGRKIPRVIPITERRRSNDSADSSQFEDVPSEGVVEVTENLKLTKKDDENSNKQELDNAFKELMETTSMPELPDIQSTLKCEQNFHGSKTIKFPDKQMKEILPSEETDNAESSQPIKLATKGLEKIATNTPDKRADEISLSRSTHKVEKSESTVVPTKLINPKKRFVKSFEDFEHKQNVMKINEELNLLKRNQKQTVSKVNPVEEDSSTTDFLKLKTRIMSKIIQQANIDEESKNKIMAKMENSVAANKDEIMISSESRSINMDKEILIDPVNIGHAVVSECLTYKQRPLSNFSEICINENMKDSIEKKTEIRATNLEDNSNLVFPDISHSHQNKRNYEGLSEVIDNVPPKKKLPRRMSHPKKDRTVLENFESIGELYVCNINTDEDQIGTIVSKSELSEIYDEGIPEIPVFTDRQNKVDHLLADTSIVVDDENSVLPSDSNLKPVAGNCENFVASTNISHVSAAEVTVFEKVQELNDNVDGNKIRDKVQYFAGSSREPVTAASLNMEESPKEKSNLIEHISSENPLIQHKLVETELNNVQKMSSQTVEEIGLYKTKEKVLDPTVFVPEIRDMSANKKKSFYENVLKAQVTETSCSIGTLLVSEKEECDALEKASAYLPEDAICSPPRKRKQSETCYDAEVVVEENSGALPKKMKKEFVDDVAYQNSSFEVVDIYTSHKTTENENITDYRCIPEISPIDNTLDQVTECVIELVSKVSESQCEQSNNTSLPEVAKGDISLKEKSVTNSELATMNDIESKEKIVTEKCISYADILKFRKSPKLCNVDSGLIITDYEERDKLKDQTDETGQKINFPQINTGHLECREEGQEEHISVYPKEEIINEEVIYFDEQDTLMENIVESNEHSSKDTLCIMKASDEVSQCFKKQLSENIIDTTVENVKNNDVHEQVLEEESLHSVDVPKKPEILPTQISDISKELILNGDEDEQIKCVEQTELSLCEVIAVEARNEQLSNKEISIESSHLERLNQVDIPFTGNSGDLLKFSIQANPSNFPSQKKTSEIGTSSKEMECCSSEDGSNISCIEQHQKKQDTVSFKHYTKHELVSVEGNLTVVSETDLADGQVEITSEQVISPKKLASPTHFHTDFSDATNESSSTNDTLSDNSKGFDSRGTEFTSKAMMKEVRSSIGVKKSNAYGRTELLDILEGNLDIEKRNKESFIPQNSIIEDFCDFEDHIPSQIVCAKRLKQEKDEMIKEMKEKGSKSKKNYKIASTTSKLLERLTENKKDVNKTLKTEKSDLINKQTNSPLNMKLLKAKSNCKPIILSEQIIKPAVDVQITNSKKALEDIEDVEAFIIHKDLKKPKCEDVGIEVTERKHIDKKITKSSKQSGKAKILQQTIITASGEIIQPTITSVQTDEHVFDINSMPIVLSDEILTPENIEKIPIVISSDPPSTSPILKEKVTVTVAGRKSHENKSLTKITFSAPSPAITHTSSKPFNPASKVCRTSKILQNSTTKVVQRDSPLPNSPKLAKFILVPQNLTSSPTKGLNQMMLKRASTLESKVQPSNSLETGGNKIMILTNQQGQKQRLLLTPAQQKLLGCQTPTTKPPQVTNKGNIIPNTISNLSKKLTPTSSIETNVSLGNKSLGTLGNNELLHNSPVVDQNRTTSTVSRLFKTGSKKPLLVNQKPNPAGAKIQQSIAVKKTQETDEELEKQVAEQLEAIKASSGNKFESQMKTSEPIKISNKTTAKRSYLKKPESKAKISPNLNDTYSVTGEILPHFSSALNSKKSALKESVVLPKVAEPKLQTERPLNQLVIQDAVGNQTTITEGQILALPSETIDGQPQSYMLVTLDETGNLIPLNNEALMSLDPNLGLGGDIGNMVLQIEQGSLTSTGIQHPPPLAQSAVVKCNKESGNVLQSIPEALDRQNPVNIHPQHINEPSSSMKSKVSDLLSLKHNVEQTAVPHTNNETGQQLIISGDPVATQKFLESLSEGTTDLANLLANAEGNSILIQADGQQILINTDSENQMLLSVNNNTSIHENSEGGGNPIFATQPNKSQDILAAALADTDVFQQDQHSSQSKFPSQLSPNNSLYPINVGNVLETSLTLSSPIMTPLEVPSLNNKKIPDEETDILTQVPKNVDLPITITDPNISQTVANQQVASLIATELHSNLGLNLPLSDTTITSATKDMHSPYSYSLSTLDDSVDITQKTLSSSMPLLNDDVDESVTDINKVELTDLNLKQNQMSSVPENILPKETLGTNKSKRLIVRRSSFLDDDDDDEEEGRFTLGREMCSSLSEPPPEMFDIAEVNSSYVKTSLPSSLQSTPDPSERPKDDEMMDLSTQAESSNDGSCEIPVQPKIIAESQNLDLLNLD